MILLREEQNTDENKIWIQSSIGVFSYFFEVRTVINMGHGEFNGVCVNYDKCQIYQKVCMGSKQDRIILKN